MHTIPLKFTLLLLSYLITICNATNSPLCHPHDKAVLLKTRDRLGDPEGQLSSWDPNTDCCSNWSYVGCQTNTKGKKYARINSLTFGYNLGFKGNLPSELGELPYLETLSLAHNINVTGSIPKSFAKLKNLFLLELASNSLSGHIPKYLLGIKSLQLVDLSRNHLSGILPLVSSSMSSSSLVQFDVSHNELCGRIPNELKRFGRTSFQHNKCLCGPPLAACK